MDGNGRSLDIASGIDTGQPVTSSQECGRVLLGKSHGKHIPISTLLIPMPRIRACLECQTSAWGRRPSLKAPHAYTTQTQTRDNGQTAKTRMDCTSLICLPQAGAKRNSRTSLVLVNGACDHDLRRSLKAFTAGMPSMTSTSPVKLKSSSAALRLAMLASELLGLLQYSSQQKTPCTWQAACRQLAGSWFQRPVQA